MLPCLGTGLRSFHGAEDPATSPLPKDACTSREACLPSTPTKLQDHLWQQNRASNWASFLPPHLQRPCQLALVPHFEHPGWITEEEGDLLHLMASTCPETQQGLLTPGTQSFVWSEGRLCSSSSLCA